MGKHRQHSHDGKDADASPWGEAAEPAMVQLEYFRSENCAPKSLVGGVKIPEGRCLNLGQPKEASDMGSGYALSHQILKLVGLSDTPFFYGAACGLSGACSSMKSESECIEGLAALRPGSWSKVCRPWPKEDAHGCSVGYGDGGAYSYRIQCERPQPHHASSEPRPNPTSPTVRGPWSDVGESISARASGSSAPEADAGRGGASNVLTLATSTPSTTVAAVALLLVVGACLAIYLGRKRAIKKLTLEGDRQSNRLPSVETGHELASRPKKPKAGKSSRASESERAPLAAASAAASRPHCDPDL